MSKPLEAHRLSTTSFAGKRRCVCGRRVEQTATGRWHHVERKAMSNPVIPDEAVEAAAAVLLGYTGSCSCHEGYTGRNLIDPDCSYHDVPPEVARLILEAAAPHMLSHEREETRLAHVDAVVNRDAVDRLEKTLDAIAALHQREVIATHEGYGEEAWCPACRVHWPCKTADALDATIH